MNLLSLKANPYGYYLAFNGIQYLCQQLHAEQWSLDFKIARSHFGSTEVYFKQQNVLHL